MPEIKKIFVMMLLVTLSVGFAGCGVFMPYKSEFQCESPYKGKCVSVKEAYDESRRGIARNNREAEKEDADIDTGGAGERTSLEYRNNLQRELSKLIESPVTPVILPPKVIRILVFPYPDRSVLYMPRYIYMMTDGPEWVIGNYLTGKEGH